MRVLSFCLAVALTIVLLLPWFKIPLLAWAIPVPAWSRAGLVCLAVSAVLALRALAGLPWRWLVRGLLPFALYEWWRSPEEMMVWGTRTFGPVQLKLSALNAALSKFGVDPVQLYEPSAWKELQPGLGWYAAGGVLAAASLFAVLDGPRIRNCAQCQAPAREEDGFCHQCGEALQVLTRCGNCARPAEIEDKFCRDCGHSLKEV